MYIFTLSIYTLSTYLFIQLKEMTNLYCFVTTADNAKNVKRMQKVSEYDQEIPQSHTADQTMVLRQRDAEY